MNQYVGIPFSERPCWSLAQLVYKEQFGVRLPSAGEPAPETKTIPEPVDGCLVHVRRSAPLAEHWGIYHAGYVLHAQRPTSVMIPLSRFLSLHPHVEYLQVIP